MLAGYRYDFPSAPLSAASGAAGGPRGHFAAQSSAAPTPARLSRAGVTVDSLRRSTATTG